MFLTNFAAGRFEDAARDFNDDLRPLRASTFRTVPGRERVQETRESAVPRRRDDARVHEKYGVLPRSVQSTEPRLRAADRAGGWATVAPRRPAGDGNLVWEVLP